MKLIVIFFAFVSTGMAEDVNDWQHRLMEYEYCLFGKVVERNDEKSNLIEVSIMYWGEKDCYLSKRLSIPKSKHIPVGSMIFLCIDKNPPKQGSARYSYIMRENGFIMFWHNRLSHQKILEIAKKRKKRKNK